MQAVRDIFEKRIYETYRSRYARGIRPFAC